jgi:tetratricopeptide (TPR) repeat protein
LSAVAYLDRGRAWCAKGDYNKALADYDEAIRLAPRAAVVYHNRGYLHFQKCEYDQALADYDEAIRLSPSVAVTYYDRGRVRFAKRDCDRALADFDEVIRLDPRCAVAREMRGHVRYAIGEYEEALADFGEALRLDPDSFMVYAARSWIRATCPDTRLRDGGLAVKDGLRACEITGWRHATVIETLSAAYAEAGDFAHAFETQVKAQTLLPEGEVDRHDVGDRLGMYRPQ